MFLPIFLLFASLFSDEPFFILSAIDCLQSSKNILPPALLPVDDPFQGSVALAIARPPLELGEECVEGRALVKRGVLKDWNRISFAPLTTMTDFHFALKNYKLEHA